MSAEGRPERAQRTRRELGNLDEAERWLKEDPGERRRLAWALAVAMALHATLLFARLPDWGPDPVRVDAPKEQAMKVQFLQPPPPPPKAPPKPPVPERKKIARPDPTPDEPEPEVAPPQPPAPPDAGETSNQAVPAPSMGPIRVSPGQGPGIIKRVEPIYPPSMRAARQEGTVQLDAVIHADGTVGEITVVKSVNSWFDRSAMEALEQWRFEPGSHDVIMTLTVHFKLER